MNKYVRIIFPLVACLIQSCSPDYSAADSPLQYVDTRVGTAASATRQAGRFGKGSEEYAQTLPAVLVPNGMNFWTPQTRDTEKKCVAPYYYKDSLLQGFRNSHWIVGGCTQDYGSMTLMPLSGTLKCQPVNRASLFSHHNEVATPAYYAVRLDSYGIQAEMTATTRSALFAFTYSDDEAYLIVNPNSDEGQGTIEVDPERREIRGYNPVHRIYQGWGEPAGFNGYFIVRWDADVEAYGTYHEEAINEGETHIAGKPRIGAFVRFRLPSHKKVLVKAASSFTSMQGARNNLESEIPDWDFDRVRSGLEQVWNNTLSAVRVETDNETDKRKFYSAMYRASFLPRVFNDVDGSYPSFAQGTPIRKMEQGDYYEDFSMWDTYRALHPLLNILSPRKSGEMMQSLTLKYEQGGWMPVFPCWNSYTAAMIGDHCVATLADAYVKGVRNFNVEKAYEGARKNAFESPASFEAYKNGMGRRALHTYLQYGYIPLEEKVAEAYHTEEQVSRTLEYAYDDFALSQWAAALGRTEDAATLKERARNYLNVIDPSTGYARGRYASGEFIAEYDPFDFVSFITEGTPAHYTWYVPHDVPGLMRRMGGEEAFVAKLDSMFTEGLYWHGNEPCHQVPFLFNYAGRPWRTQEEVRHLMQTEYLDAPGGLSGNDDAGQMSAWYIFAALGFYPVCPSTPYYQIASPSFTKATLRLENGKEFVITAPNASPENIYIQSVKLNGKDYTKNYFSHADIVEGGKFEFVMGATPNKNWGSLHTDCLP